MRTNLKNANITLRIVCCLTAVLVVAPVSVFADITYNLDNPQNWPSDIRAQIENSIAEAVALYNRHGSFNKHLNIQYNSGVPTADANYNGNIRFGGSRNTRVALHEIMHTLGVGTRFNQYTGPYATAMLEQFDGPGSVLQGSGGIHFWPYGLNYDNEDGTQNRYRHIRLVAALRCDWGYLSFMQEPSSVVLPLGDTAVFSVDAVNATGYRWYKQGVGMIQNGGRYSGATSNTLQISNVNAEDVGQYYCRITSGSSNQDSRTARLIPERLMGIWGFEGNTFDNIGANHGTPGGSPTYTTGMIGQAILLDGVDDHVTLPAGIADGNGITVCSWVYWNGGNQWQRLFDFGSNTSQYLFLTPRSGSNTLRFAIRNGGSEQIVETSQLTSGEWVHVAVTLGNGIGRLFLNGQQVASNPTMTIKPLDFGPVNNYIGRSQFSADPFFNGRVDDLRIYNYAIDASEVSRIVFERSSLMPWGGAPHPLPGKIQAEHFDFGGQGIAYHDTTAGNSGGQLRNFEDVDIFTTTDSGGGYAVGNIETGEWLLYTVNSTASQTSMYARVASTQAGGQIKVWLDDDLLGTIAVPNTGSLTTWTTVGISGVALPDRQNAKLKIEFVGTGFRLNMIDFNNRAPFLGYPMPVPGRIQFEDFDIGGQLISYFDKSPTNGYGQYRTSEPVDIMMIVDGGVVGYAPFMEATEWMEYTCQVEPGYYTLVVRTSSPYAPQQFTLSVGIETLAVFNLPQTNGFFNWTNTTVPNVYLAGGEMQLRFNMVSSSGVVNYVDFVREYNVADLTQSGRVDLDDFAILAAQWLGVPGVPSADIAPAGGDGQVNLPDLLLMADNWLMD